MPEPSGLLLRGVDRAAFVTALCGRLRGAGVRVGLTPAENLARAMAVTPLESVGSVYWAARVTLVRRHEDLATFDRVFAEVFDADVGTLDRLPPSRGHVRPRTKGGSATVSPRPLAADDGAGAVPWATLPAVTGVADPEESDVAVPERMPSAVQAVADVPFEDLDADQLRLLSTWLESAWRNWPCRRTRRMRLAAGGGPVALRATLARSRQTGWEPVQLRRRRPVHRPRQLVVLCDVSQSMQAYTTAYLHVMRAATLVADAEVFAFATGVTRLTAVMKHTDTDVALQQATDRVTDRFGGTRIAASLRTVLTGRHGSALRGGVVVVASDGWDSDPPEDLRRVMERVARRAHRVVWLNPRSATAAYQPLVGSMAAALPYCDDFLPAHTATTLVQALTLIAE